MSAFDASKIFSVPGLVAVVTGGGSGIGLMMTKALALNGASKVYIIGRREEVLEKAAKESPHGNIIPIVGDVTSKDSLKAAADRIKNEVGFVNVLIANSGVGGVMLKTPNQTSTVEEYQSEMEKLDIDDLTNVFRVNVSSVLLTAIAFLGLLDAGNKKKNMNQFSQIIATGSIAGFNRNVTGGYGYGISKTACVQMVKQLATILSPFGIRSNVICPGLFPSELAAPIIQNVNLSRDILPAQRLGEDEDMAGTILYLCSRAGAYNNGNVIIPDGGRLSMVPNSF